MAARQRATLKEISHTPPAGESITAVWERGKKAESDD